MIYLVGGLFHSAWLAALTERCLLKCAVGGLWLLGGRRPWGAPVLVCQGDSRTLPYDLSRGWMVSFCLVGGTYRRVFVEMCCWWVLVAWWVAAVGRLSACGKVAFVRARQET